LDGLSEMLGTDSLSVVQISDGPCHFEYPVMRASRQSEPPYGHFESTLAGVVEGAQLAQGRGRDVGVVEASLPLPGAGTADALANFG